MAIILLGVYITLIFLRPMEWWDPVLHYPLVTPFAYATILAALPQILGEHRRLWRAVPEMRFAVGLLFGVTFSWLYPLWLNGIRMAFQDFGKIIVLYLLIIILARDPRRFGRFLWIILVCVGWMAVHGLLQHFTNEGFGGEAPLWRASSGIYQIRAFGIFEDPNDLCLVFIMTIPILFAIFRAESNVAIKIVCIALFPLVVWGAWLTNSRGGVIGIFGMLAAYAIARTRGARRWVVAGIGIAVVTVLAPARFAKGMGVDTSRLVLWGDAVAAFKRYPVLGVGYQGIWDYVSEEKAVHNSYIHALSELGIVGYVPFFMLIYLTMVHVRRALNQKDLISRRDQLYLSGLYSGMVGYLTALYFLSRQYNHVLYVMLALCLCQVLIVCRDPRMYERVFGPYSHDLKRGLWFAMASIPFFWVTIRIGYAVGGR